MYQSRGYHDSRSRGYPESRGYGERAYYGDNRKPAMGPDTTEFRKCFYNPSSACQSVSEEQVEAFRKEHEIRVSGAELKPFFNFEDAGFPSEYVDLLYRAGFKRPSPIQAQAWPILMSGHDMIGIAETGSGKTLAFLMPAVVHIADQRKVNFGEGPVALVLAPTRELVEQIKEEANKFTGRMRTGVAYGGVSKRMQMNSIRGGIEFMIACPGRLMDFMDRGIVTLRRVTYLVLDEADRMLDMGFEPQIRKIVGDIRPDRQTLMFSATWPKEVQSLARDLCKEDPVQVTIGTAELKASHNIEQHVLVITEDSKRDRLFDILNEEQSKDRNARIIIFTETKKGCDVLTRELRARGFPALCIHGDKEQSERSYVLDEFKSGRHPIMVATDVASRGLDVKDVRIVINYDMPGQIEDYVHRIGRTGRAGARGVSHAFMTDKSRGLARDLMKILQEAKQLVPKELEDMAHYSRGGNSGRGNRRFGGRGYGGGSGYSSRPYGGGNNYGGGYGYGGRSSGGYGTGY